LYVFLSQRDVTLTKERKKVKDVHFYFSQILIRSYLKKKISNTEFQCQGKGGVHNEEEALIKDHEK